MASFFYNSTTQSRYFPAKKQLEVDGRIYVNPSVATLADLGYEEVTIAARPDERFYIIEGPDETGAYTSTPKALEDTGSGDTLVKGLRSQYLDQQKFNAGQYLAATDWYVVREAETATAIPDAIATFRAEVRTVCAANETLLTDAADFDAFVALVTAPEEILDTDGETWIENPAPHLSGLPVHPEV